MAISKLQWHRVSDCEWQAGGGNRYYSIMEDMDAKRPQGEVVCFDVGYIADGKVHRLGSSYSFPRALELANRHHAAK